jgi:O-antigen ligase
LFGWLVPAAAAWGVLAFGAVYRWAYAPLLIVCAAIGIAALLRGLGHAWPRGLAAGLAAVALTISLQLVPLPRDTLAAISPTTDGFLRQHNVPYSTATAVTNDSTASWRSHPVSLYPASTRRAVGFVVALGVFLFGLTAHLSAGRAAGEGRPRWLRDTTTILAESITILGVVVALIGVIQKATVTTGKIYGFWTPEQAGNPFGPFVNKNHFAGWMVMALALAIGLCCGRIARGMRGVKPGWRNRILWFSSPDANRLILTAFAAVVMGLALVLSFSRSGITCFAIAIVLSAWFVARRQTTASKRAVAGAYLAFVLVMAVGWAGLDAVAKRFADASWNDVGGRWGAWQDTLRIAGDFPLTGIGLNTFGEAMLDYQTTYLNLHFASAHNDWLQPVAEGGLLVGIPILVTLILFVREVRRRFREDAEETMSFWLRAGAVTGLVAIALQEVVEFSLQILEEGAPLGRGGAGLVPDRASYSTRPSRAARYRTCPPARDRSTRSIRSAPNTPARSASSPSASNGGDAR